MLHRWSTLGSPLEGLPAPCAAGEPPTLSLDLWFKEGKEKRENPEIRLPPSVPHKWMFSMKYAFFLDLIFPPRSDIIMPESAKPGDVLLLTKPLGTQVSSSAKGFKIIVIRSNYKSKCFFGTSDKGKHKDTFKIKDIAFYKVAVNAHQWMEEEGEKWQKVSILSIQSVPSILSILMTFPPDCVQGEFCWGSQRCLQSCHPLYG